jgi:hypothetical protein
VLKQERKINKPEMLISFMTNDKENFEDNQKNPAAMINSIDFRNSLNGKIFVSFIQSFDRTNACDYLEFVNLDCSFCMKFWLSKILRKKHSKQYGNNFFRYKCAVCRQRKFR